MKTPSTFPGRAQVADRHLGRQIEQLAEEWISLPFSEAVAAGQRVQVAGTYTFTTYVTGGVPIPGLETASAVAMLPWTNGLGAVYLFKWDPAAHEMIVTDWSGWELANGTDISAITNHAYTASLDGTLSSGMVPTATHRMTGAGRIVAIEIETAADFAANDTNYWTITARLLQANPVTPQTVGILIATLSTRQRSFVAGEPLEVYATEAGFAAEDGDKLILTAAASGTPGALLGATVWAKIQRRVV